MEVEVYNALAAINQATEQITENLKKLEDAGFLTRHFAEIRILAARENCTETNVSVVHNLTTRELENATSIQRQRMEKETQMKGD